MVIEWLKFRVSPELRDKFIELDQAIWTKTLATYAGFVGKEVWINPNQPTEVITVIYWQTREDWKAIPSDVLEATEADFQEAMGEGSYQIEQSLEYQVRKFPGYH